MARFVDLEHHDSDGDPVVPQRVVVGTDAVVAHRLHDVDTAEAERRKKREAEESQRLPGTDNAATSALHCWPIIIAIVSFIDLTTLDALARTSRGVHDGLVQYSRTLVASTLRCRNEQMPIDSGQSLRYRARAGNWFYMEDGRGQQGGKAGPCARDMVGECRRCGDVVCRNCAIKPPAPVALRERHRRLCRTCVSVPIGRLAKPRLDDDVPLHDDAMQRAVCKCADKGVWLCQPCGKSIRGADHEYRRIWRWRNHYGEVLGGLGTGIGGGDRGVICGREQECCAAKKREEEIDCDAEDAKDSGNGNLWAGDFPNTPGSNASSSNGSTGGAYNPNPNGNDYIGHHPHHHHHDQQHNHHHQTAHHVGSSSPPTNHHLLHDDFLSSSPRTPSPLGPGYARHEIEGIGGVVKRKLVRMVRVGACVPEWDDELGAGGGRVLSREVAGETRSWCGWCWRVVPGTADEEEHSSCP